MIEKFYSNGCAVYARDVCFSYSKSDQILKGINLSIERSSIYGLLGSSGCGKTTLLKCILGRLKAKSGEIQIFGAKPGSPECKIPGPGVGYMPQELGLYFEFTIKEILTYFGRIYAMNKSEIEEKAEQLIQLLQLPTKNKLIGQLSGGQQRRVSLACTLVHTPPLLILDEPTVGTDPVLRQNIWFHLLSLRNSGHTIIVTTHYIEEARNAKAVAFMRNGKILAEDDPEVLLDRYDSTNLEDVFLHLCHLESKESKEGKEVSLNIEKQNHCYENIIVVTEAEECDHKSDESNENSNNLNKNYLFANIKDDVQSLDVRRRSELSLISENSSIQCLQWIQKNDNNDNKQVFKSDLNHNVLVRDSGFKNRCSALMHKNFRRITRNWGHLLFEILFTSLLLIIVVISISDGPSNLNIAVYDEEVAHNVTDNWGELFVKHIDKNIFNIFYYDSMDAAIDSVNSGENYAAIDINERFTKAFRLRFVYMGDTDDETLEESQIRVHIDRSNQLIGLQIERYLYHAMFDFTQDVANRSNINPEAIKIPLHFEEPVYGDSKESLREFLLPGAYILLTFFTTAAVTAHLVHEEKREGLLERSLVAGITSTEFLVANLLTQFLILCFQIILLLSLPYVMFTTVRQLTGSLPLFIALTFSQGFCGVAFGLFVAVLIEDTIVGALTIIFLFFASIVTGGVLWPIENMPLLMQYFTKLMPNTIAIQSMRNIVFREWSIDYFQVQIGFISTYLWFTIFIVISMIFLKRNL